MKRAALSVTTAVILALVGAGPASLAQSGPGGATPTPEPRPLPRASNAQSREQQQPRITLPAGHAEQPGADAPQVATVTPPAGVTAVPLEDRPTTTTRGNRTLTARAIKRERLADGREAVSERLIVAFRDGVTDGDVNAIHALAASRGAGRARPVANIGRRAHLVEVSGTASLSAAVQAYRADPRVAYVEPDVIRKVSVTPDDPRFVEQWDLSQIGAPGAWNFEQGSSSVRVAIVDSGIYDEVSSYPPPDGGRGHPDLRNKVVAHANFTPEADTDDFNGHGTHVAGTVSANTNNGVGVASLGWRTSLMAAKACTMDGSCTSSAVANAVHWAVDNGARVINLSLGGSGACTGTDQEMVSYAWSHGAVVVVAAGNDGTATVTSPASCPNALAVASLDSNNQKSSFSSFGNWVQVAAPGGFSANGHAILSTSYIGDYTEKAGTSMAAPHVSALAALLWNSATWGGGNQAVVDRIEHSVDDFSAPGGAWTFGRINASRAVHWIQPQNLPGGESTSAVGSPITVGWSYDTSFETPWDFIGMYRAGDPDTAPLATQYVNCTTSPLPPKAFPGSCAFTPPSAGHYEFRLFADASFSRPIGVIGRVNVTRSAAASFTASTNVPPGGSTTVSWSGLQFAEPGDWIGLYDSQLAPVNAYLDYRFINCSQTAGASPSNGSCVIPVPPGPGQYQLRLIAANTTTVLNTTTFVKPIVGAGTFTATPGTPAPGATISVAWNTIGTPTGRDWIGLFPTGAGADAFLDWKFVNCTRSATVAVASGSCSFTAPALAGPYEVRLYSNNGSNLLNQASVTVAAPVQGTLSASPASVAASSSVTVSWSGITPSVKDWIGLYANSSAGASSFLLWSYTSSCTHTPGGSALASGSCTFAMPTTAGSTYEFRLFSNDGDTRLATSNTVTVTPPASATLSVSPSQVAPGAATTVTWASIPAPAAKDWIGLYMNDTAADSAFIDWKYVSCARTTGAAQASGSCAFTAPTLPGTTYQFRLFANDSFTRLATAGPLVVSNGGVGSVGVSPTSVAQGGTVTFSWSALNPATSRDWIGLYPSGAGPEAFLDWKYVNCTRAATVSVASGSCGFVAPATAGTYEVRLFTNDSFSQVGTSQQFAVTPQAGPSMGAMPFLVNRGGTITVTWADLPNPTALDWIGLYPVGATATNFVEWKYVSCSHAAGSAAANGSCTFTAPTNSGMYELRLYANDGFSLVVSSNQITVTSGTTTQSAPAGPSTKPGSSPVVKPGAGG